MQCHGAAIVGDIAPSDNVTKKVKNQLETEAMHKIRNMLGAQTAAGAHDIHIDAEQSLDCMQIACQLRNACQNAMHATVHSCCSAKKAYMRHHAGSFCEYKHSTIDMQSSLPSAMLYWGHVYVSANATKVSLCCSLQSAESKLLCVEAARGYCSSGSKHDR